MHLLLRIVVFEKRRAIEVGERPVVGRKVPGHPVEEHADAGLMQAVDQKTQVIGAAEARTRREETSALIAPGLVERMLHDRHEFNVRIALLKKIGHQPLGQLAVAVETAVGVCLLYTSRCV